MWTWESIIENVIVLFIGCTLRSFGEEKSLTVCSTQIKKCWGVADITQLTLTILLGLVNLINVHGDLYLNEKVLNYDNGLFIVWGF